MNVTVIATDDSEQVLTDAADYLASDPVLHNLVLTLLRTRATNDLPGRYWMAAAGGEIVGVTFQSPLDYRATVTPMAAEVVDATVDAVGSGGSVLPGVNGEAGTVARFAGRWTELNRSSAVPDMGQRIYEVDRVRRPNGVAGSLRRADPDHLDRLIEWITVFPSEVGGLVAGDIRARVERQLDAGQCRIWENDAQPVSLCAHSSPVEGVARIQAVFTPPEHRGNGYASAAVAQLASQLRAKSLRCILYTDLGNPISNSMYRRIGFEAVAEALRYRFKS